jgi:thermostable 8-oxoguanine DNA glycosylase
MRLVIDKDKSPSSKEYDQIESEFQRIANHIGLLPSELQAICWSVIRKTNN